MLLMNLAGKVEMSIFEEGIAAPSGDSELVARGLDVSLRTLFCLDCFLKLSLKLRRKHNIQIEASICVQKKKLYLDRFFDFSGFGTLSLTWSSVSLQLATEDSANEELTLLSSLRSILDEVIESLLCWCCLMASFLLANALETPSVK